MVYIRERVQVKMSQRCSIEESKKSTKCGVFLSSPQGIKNVVYSCISVYIYAQSLKSCSTLWDPMDYSRPGSPVHGILQVRILEWVVMSFSRGSYRPRDQTRISCIAGRFFTDWATGGVSAYRVLPMGKLTQAFSVQSFYWDSITYYLGGCPLVSSPS